MRPSGQRDDSMRPVAATTLLAAVALLALPLLPAGEAKGGPIQIHGHLTASAACTWRGGNALPVVDKAGGADSHPVLKEAWGRTYTIYGSSGVANSGKCVTWLAADGRHLATWSQYTYSGGRPDPRVPEGAATVVVRAVHDVAMDYTLEIR